MFVNLVLYLDFVLLVIIIELRLSTLFRVLFLVEFNVLINSVYESLNSARDRYIISNDILDCMKS